MERILRQYNHAADAYVALTLSGGLAPAASIQAADWQVSIDGGAYAQLATAPTVSNGVAHVRLSATETLGRLAVVRGVDSHGTKTYDDVAILVETYGSEFSQHPYIGANVWAAASRTLTATSLISPTDYDQESIGGDEMDLVQKSSRLYEVTVPDVPVGRRVTKAWFMVKNSDSDSDGSAVLSKVITASASGAGQIVDDGSADSTAVLQFLVGNTDLDALDTSKVYASSVKVELDNGNAYALPGGFRPVTIHPPGVVAVS